MGGREVDGGGVDRPVDPAVGVKRGEPIGEARCIREVFGDRNGFSHLETVGDGYCPVPLSDSKGGAVELAGGEDLLDMLMARGRRGANPLQEAIHAVGGTGGTGEADEDRSFQLLVRRQPLLDIAVRT